MARGVAAAILEEGVVVVAASTGDAERLRMVVLGGLVAVEAIGERKGRETGRGRSEMGREGVGIGEEGGGRVSGKRCEEERQEK